MEVKVVSEGNVVMLFEMSCEYEKRNAGITKVGLPLTEHVELIATAIPGGIVLSLDASDPLGKVVMKYNPGQQYGVYIPHELIIEKGCVNRAANELIARYMELQTVNPQLNLNAETRGVLEEQKYEVLAELYRAYTEKWISSQAPDKWKFYISINEFYKRELWNVKLMRSITDQNLFEKYVAWFNLRHMI